MVPLEIFEGKILTDLQDEYVQIMQDYSNCMDGIDNEEADKWKQEYQNLTFDIKKDYLASNNVENYDDVEFNQAMEEHKAITVDLGTGAKTYNTNTNGQITIPTKDLPAKTYVANIRFNGDDNYMPSNATAKITINKQTTQITATGVTTIYNINKDFVITLKHSQNSPLAKTKITVNFGTGAKTYTTDNNGQVKISTATLVPNTYTVKIAFEGNDNYMKSSSTAKVTVKKATPKVKAKAATFKKSLKIKKYSIILKNNKNQAMKKVKVTLKVKGKTYSAITTKKGLATFKITKLTKKGKFTATIKYNGNKYYTKLTKNIKIRVK